MYRHHLDDLDENLRGLCNFDSNGNLCQRTYFPRDCLQKVTGELQENLNFFFCSRSEKAELFIKITNISQY